MPPVFAAAPSCDDPAREDHAAAAAAAATTAATMAGFAMQLPAQESSYVGIPLPVKARASDGLPAGASVLPTDALHLHTLWTTVKAGGTRLKPIPELPSLLEGFRGWLECSISVPRRSPVSAATAKNYSNYMGNLLKPGGLTKHGITGRRTLDKLLLSEVKASALNKQQHHGFSCALGRLLEYIEVLDDYEVDDTGALVAKPTGQAAGCWRGQDPDCEFNPRMVPHSLKCDRAHKAVLRAALHAKNKAEAEADAADTAEYNRMRRQKYADKRRLQTGGPAAGGKKKKKVGHEKP